MKHSAPSSMLASVLPLFSAVLKKCALVAFHVFAEEGRGEEVGCGTLGLGDEWKMGRSKSPMWESEGVSGSEEESVSSSVPREGNVGNEALHVIGLYGPGDKISLFLQDGELAGFELPHCPGHAVPGTACALSSHRGRAATAKERVVVRGNTRDEPF